MASKELRMPMRLYLVQHAEAKREEEDPSRPLSERGIGDIMKVARFAQEHLHIHVQQIIHSGKLRAKETAEALANHLYPPKGIVEAQGLEPQADPRIWRNRLAEATADTMLVGHLPHLSRLVGQLLCGDEDREVMAFKMGGIVCLGKDEAARWTIQWMITPEILT